jgi:SAM-dependent MidA family methyltransferase
MTECLNKNIMQLPQPDTAAREISSKLTHHIREEIALSGRIDFARYMSLALYTPGLGYYSAGTQKFGEAGDFITAPELSPLFGQCVAKQIAEVLNVLGEGDILEFGAGSGRLAVDILQHLATLNTLPRCYYILEVSADLKARQQALISQALPEFCERVYWLHTLPKCFSGVVLANEVLDAMPVHRFCQNQSGIKESFVHWEQGTFAEYFDKPSEVVQQSVEALNLVCDQDYVTEISLLISAWINSLAACLKQGLILLIDYGFVRREFYHPDRCMGTLMCHYRHHSHHDVFFYPGLQDITAHVDFTAVAESALQAGLNVLGYTTQAYFLMGCGLMEISQHPVAEVRTSYQIAQQIKRLVLPSEMGELFKVIALGKNMDTPLLGFTCQDMREKL